MLLALLLAITAPPKGHWAVDETGKVSAATLAAFDAIARRVDESGAGQLGLAVVSSTHGAPPRGFATQIFNRWGVGHRGANDGVLLFFALDDHKSEIVLGDGFPGDATLQTDSIMRNDVVTNMKAGRLDDAVKQAAMSLAAFIARVGKVAPAAPVSEPEVKERSPRSWMLDLDYPVAPSQAARFDREGDAVYASGKGMLFAGMYPGSMSTARFAERLREKLHREDVWVVFGSVVDGSVHVDAPGAKRVYPDIERELNRIEQRASERVDDPLARALEAMHSTAQVIVEGAPAKPLSELVEEHTVGLLGGFGVTGLLGLVSLRSWMRRRPRGCDKCGNPRQRLSEETDDPHLNPGQRLEESLGSVDYDVWWCGRCNDALVLRYGAIFSSYGECERCTFKTASSSSMTIVEATYDHGGTVEVTESCRNCSHVHRYTRHTSRLTRSDDSSSSSSWSSSSSSSFGGGSSSGGGSSGSW